MQIISEQKLEKRMLLEKTLSADYNRETQNCFCLFLTSPLYSDGAACNTERRFIIKVKENVHYHLYY